MIDFSLKLKTRIHFGKNAISNLNRELNPYKRILLVTGRGSIKKYGIYDAVMSELSGTGKEIFELSGVKPNPSIDSVYEGIKICNENNIDFILALGGGSVIDAAKAVAAGACYNGDAWDLFIGKGSLTGAISLGNILTIAATGSESNPNAVVTNEKTKEKLPLINEALRPVFAILDPTYTYTLPPFQTAAGISDIMAHVFEQYFSPTKDAFLTDRISESVMKTCIKYAPVVMKDPENYEARAEIMWASTVALNGLLSCGKISDWACHITEHELSAYYDLNHGAGLAILFPVKLQQAIADSTLWKFKEYALNVWNLPSSMSDTELAEESVKKTREFFDSLNLPNKLSQVGINSEYFEIMAENVVKRGMTGSFKQLNKQDIIEIYKKSL